MSLFAHLKRRRQAADAALRESSARLRHDTLVYNQQAALARESVLDLAQQLAAVDEEYAGLHGTQAWVQAKTVVLAEARAAAQRRKSAASEMLRH